MPDALLEGLQRHGLAARSFREDDLDLAAVERLFRERERVAASLPLSRFTGMIVVANQARKPLE